MGQTELVFLVAYFALVAALCCYGAHRYALAWLYYRHRRDVPAIPAAVADAELPLVTVQLPVFNERYVLRRLVEHVCRIDYPTDRLEVQVLDDSTDDTSDLARTLVEEFRGRGIDIVHIHRQDRTGFKAGALAAGLQVARGALVAVFDADFLPPPDFLRRTVGYFVDPHVGMVQARWGHINRDYSVLTQAQSILLDGHFVVEHTARHRSGRFFNFNGTAGVWRRTCIDDAGGWQHDTLTEDLDLSYRAQLRGWRFVFLNDVVAPAEVPVELNAFKSQQHRWAKGSIQVALKLLPSILRSDVPFKVKVESLVHLTNNIAYLLMALVAVLMPIALYVRAVRGLHYALALDLPVLLVGTLSVCLFYAASQRAITRDWLHQLRFLPFVLALGVGLALNNALATVEALAGRTSPFVRTPKLGISTRGQRWVSVGYLARRSLLPWVELVFAAYYGLTLGWTLYSGVYLAVPFVLLFFVGFAYTAFMGLLQTSIATRRGEEPSAAT